MSHYIIYLNTCAHFQCSSADIRMRGGALDATRRPPLGSIMDEMAAPVAGRIWSEGLIR